MFSRNSSNGSHESLTKLDERFDELQRWQEEEQNKITEKQTKQNKQLSLEQQYMYEQLGLQFDKVRVSKDMGEVALPESETAERTKKKTAAAINFIRQTTTSGYCCDDNDSKTLDMPKKTFLRRGEGLKQRFKVDPEQFRLNNLPRYKFAGAHKRKNGALPTKKSQKEERADKQVLKSAATVGREESNQIIATEERNFQEALLSSRLTQSSSTPDSRALKKVANDADVRNADAAVIGPAPTWSKVLDSQRIMPLRIQRRHAVNISIDEDENVNIFELIEQKAQDGNIDMNSSCIKRFMSKRDERISDVSDIIPVRQSLQRLRLQPEVHEIDFSDNESDVHIEDRVETDSENTETDATNEDTDMENEKSVSNLNRVSASQTSKQEEHAHFPQSHYENTLVETATENAAQAGDDNTTNNSIQQFEQFKAILFRALENNKNNEVSKQNNNELNESENPKNLIISNELTEELQEKANLVKERLVELEKEINTFGEKNRQLAVMRKQHEEDKESFAQEHAEAMERLHDEKIQAEIYLHDERMKIEEERRKFDEQKRLQLSSLHNKDKKEIALLKQQIEELKLQLKQKEQAHITAQARLRAQVRNLEREQKRFYEEIDQLNKENKRLQLETMNISRENNNKVLLEIKRNIARLAPKMAQETQTKELHEKRTRRADSYPETAAKCDKNETTAARKSDYGILRCRAKSKSPLGTNSAVAGTCNYEKRRNNCVRFAKPVISDSDDSEDFTPSRNETCSSEALLPKACEHNSSTDQNVTNASSSRQSSAIVQDSLTDSTTQYKREIINADGSKDILYPNGNIKKISADGMSVRMLYFNKDINETDIRAGTTKYYYNESNTWHTTYLDGLQILEFPDGHVEHRHKNGLIEVHLPNNIIKIIDPSDELKSEEWRYADGTKVFKMRSGDEIVLMPNGQKEIRTKLNRRREYPDGTVKIVYPDGTQETRYSNGRVRLKDMEGKLIMDTDNLN